MWVHYEELARMSHPPKPIAEKYKEKCCFIEKC
jgi:hypothetical protein